MQLLLLLLPPPLPPPPRPFNRSSSSPHQQPRLLRHRFLYLPLQSTPLCSSQQQQQHLLLLQGPPIARAEIAHASPGFPSPSFLSLGCPARIARLPSCACSGTTPGFPRTSAACSLHFFPDDVHKARANKISVGDFGILESSSRHRSVKSHAGRSKGKKGRTSEGRIEGRGPSARSRGSTGTKMEEKRRGRKDAVDKGNIAGTKQGGKGAGLHSKRPTQASKTLLQSNSKVKAEKNTEENGQYVLLNEGHTGQTLDPNIRHPDDYYKYGPYGPHAFKGIPVGKPRQGTFTDNQAAMFSPVADEEEFDERAQLDAILAYDRRVSCFNEEIEVQYFFAFVRQTRRMGPQAPWKEWTLVAQVAIESGEELDKWRLGFRLDHRMRDVITQCAAWYRPDLIYVKKPSYQVRFEPQKEFLEELMNLLQQPELSTISAGNDKIKGGDTGTYYGKFCQLLGLNVDASEDLVISTFQTADEELKVTCLEHLLSNHPVQLLHPFTRSWREKQMKEKAGFDESNMAASTDGQTEEIDVQGIGYEEQSSKGEGEEEEIFSSDSEDEEEKWLLEQDEQFWENDAEEEMDDAEWDKKFNQSAQLLDDISEDNISEVYLTDSDDELVEAEIQQKTAGRIGDAEMSSNEGTPRELLLKAAVRPFTYFNLVKEIVMLQQILLKERLGISLE